MAWTKFLRDINYQCPFKKTKQNKKLNGFIFINEIALIFKNVPSNKNTLGPEVSKVNLTKEIPVILKLFHKIKEESILPNTLTIRIIIILKSVKNV